MDDAKGALITCSMVKWPSALSALESGAGDIAMNKHEKSESGALMDVYSGMLPLPSRAMRKEKGPSGSIRLALVVYFGGPISGSREL